MPWWGWLVLGATLFGAELMIVDLEFYLVFLGVSAILVGLAGASGLALAPWVQWFAFAIISVSSMVIFRQRVYLKLRGGAAGFPDSLEGKTLTLAEDLQPGESGRVEYRGSAWTVRNSGDDTLRMGQEVVVRDVKGLVLNVVALGTA